MLVQAAEEQLSIRRPTILRSTLRVCWERCSWSRSAELHHWKGARPRGGRGAFLFHFFDYCLRFGVVTVLWCVQDVLLRSLDHQEHFLQVIKANVQRLADGKKALPEQSRLLAAMEAGLPRSVGVSLGFDRLAMLAAGANSLAEVMAFPLDRA